MKKLARQAEQFILSNTVWAFFTGMLFTSIVLVFQEGRHQWLAYLSYAGRISLLFAPVLIFSGFRDWLEKQLPRILLILLWSFCFLAYPYLIEYSGWQKFIAPADLGKVAVRIAGTWVLVAEAAILANRYWLKGEVARQWIKRISLERAILLLAAVFAVFYAILWFSVPVNAAREASYLTMASYAFQIFIILFIYYGFYWINHYFLIDKILMQRGVVYYGFGFIATIVLFYPVAAQFISFLPMVRQTDIHPVHNGLIFEDINALVPFFGMLLSTPFIIAIKWFRQNSEIAALAKEKSETELNLLKQQINPHFFFNTLNNLYALSITQDKQTPEVILQLSELMRYVIYKGKEESVALAEEVKYIEDYIRLQQIRLHKQLDFRFETDITDEKQRIPPLLFITLVENAFKHGVEPAEGACFLHIGLKSDGKNLLFLCKNSFEEKTPESGGVGLANLRRRLELLFPGRHELTVERGQDTYATTLKLSL
ncbi:MAG: sensor histidine kinase [Lewinellaceae bacterium]|nr:sensor histidine kinase [Phaeodactylibacter sp.]MCB9039391.1 sensor histidine kinase [Lewinellaceae bacterium]